MVAARVASPPGLEGWLADGEAGRRIVVGVPGGAAPVAAGVGEVIGPGCWSTLLVPPTGLRTGREVRQILLAAGATSGCRWGFGGAEAGQVRRALRASRAATLNSRWRSFLGSHVRAGVPANASICIHAVSSVASSTTAIHTWFCAKSFKGRFSS